MNDANRWSRVSEILSRALDLPESERTAFLAEAIRDEPLLRTEVMSMFEELRGAEAFLETPPISPLGELESFGPYRIVGELGQGGMGIVYLAERSDGQFARRVAIKRIGMMTPEPELLRRFADEKQILARLDHRNIARLLDAGIDPTGVPYLVMEYVEGTPFTAYCRDRNLGVPARLALFLKVCAAVSHAHQNLVVHRDIKPGNILVTPDGEPKLLDFGIAKLMSVDPGDATRTVHRALTLDFASPEQVRGEPVNTSSDVYSLGVVLYELLADVKPYECGTRSVAEAVSLVCDLVPPPPSEVAPAKRHSSLAGDLDIIARKALEKSPADRYPSVADLGLDLEAYLDHRPIRARRPSLGYRARKLARRHRIGLTLAAFALVLLAAGVAAVLWQARIAERERQRAQARFQDVRRLANSVIYELHDAIANLPGATDARQLLVTRALEYLDRLASEARDDPSLQRELADAYHRVAQVQNSGLGANVGDINGALQSYGKALAIRESLAARTPVESQDTHGLALIEFDLGVLHRASGELALAEKYYLSATSRFEALSSEGALPDPHRRLAAVYQRLADLQTFQDQRGAALQSATRARTEAEALWEAQPEDSGSRSILASATYELAKALEGQEHYAEALERTRQARALLEAGLQENPLDAHQARILLFTLNGESRLLWTLGDVPGAVRVAEHALEVAEDAWRRDPDDRWSQTGVAVAASRLGSVLLQSRDARASARRFRQSLRIATQLVEEDPQNQFVRLEAASAEWGLGRALVSQGTSEAAAEGCEILARVQTFWIGLRDKGELPPGEVSELEKLQSWLARCPPAN